MSVQEAPPPTVIEAPGRWPGLGLREFWDYRSVAVVLARRNLKVRYRQTLIGVAWVLIQPLSLMIVMSFFFGLIFREGYTDIPYPVFFLIGLSIFFPTMKIVNEGTFSLLINQQLVTRVYVPRTLIPLSVAMATLVDLAFELIALQMILIWYGFWPSITYLALPFLILIAYATGLGIAYWFSALNVAYRDVQVALPFVDRLWWFLTPLMYPVAVVPEQLQPIYYLNPLSVVVSGFRWALAGGPVPPAYAFVLGSIVAGVLLVTGWMFFRTREANFADVL